LSARIYYSLEEARGRFGPAAVALGNFDGVHVGHRELIEATRRFAQGIGAETGVLTFHPHPTVLVAPDRVPPMICTLEQRIRLLAQTGATRILVLPFTRELSRFSPEEFVQRVLLEALQVKGTFVGENFHFGYRQAGTPEVLTSLGRKYGFETVFLKPVTYRGSIVSSSAIRKALFTRRLSFARHLLGRCFFVEGEIVAGQGIGSRQTVPTLNLLPAKDQLLLTGVSITRTRDKETGRIWPSITNVGVRPTFEGQGVTIETFLLETLKADEGPKRIEVEFRRWLRDEQKFPDAESLRRQIMHDVGRAKAYWRRTMLPETPS
jgi:riboflavin kinase/FMN adenylyltransferase